jgi:hypothetical protein
MIKNANRLRRLMIKACDEHSKSVNEGLLAELLYTCERKVMCGEGYFCYEANIKERQVIKQLMELGFRVEFQAHSDNKRLWTAYIYWWD